MRHLTQLLTCPLLIFLFAHPASAQITIVTSGASSGQINVGGTYTQNFDSLASSGTNVAWSDNTTLTGWYSSRTSYNASTGSSTSGSLYSFGSSGSTDRALGSLAASSTTYLYGLRLVNATDGDLDHFSVTYDGEQWRAATSQASAQTVAFEYQIFTAGSGSITAASGWTSLSALGFTSPVTNGSGTLDGNASANRITSLTGTATGLTLSAGSELWIRWKDTDDTGSDHGLAIDNFSITVGAVPEPSTWAAIVGAAALALTAAWKRKTAARPISRTSP